MKAVVLAGGKGTRLAPLTLETPKPLVRVLDQPVMAHILALLAHYGVDEAVVTVSYLAHEIRNRFGEEFLGIRLHYSEEPSPLGTAGGVLAATDLLQEDGEDSILIISGDAVCDFDLAKASAFHRAREADVSLLLAHSEHPLAYGVVKCRENGEILGFVEKPEWSQVCSDRVNTGIYFLKKSVLKRIPRGIQYDFSAELFPKMLSEKARLYGCLCDGYWRDIGTLPSYYAGNLDALNNKIKLYLPMDGTVINGRNGKWYCSYGASVHEDARVSAASIIGRGCHVEADAVVTNSILCDDCTVEKGAVVKDSILDRGVLVKRNAVVAAQSVVGYASCLEEGSHCFTEVLAPKSRRRARGYFVGEDDGALWEEDRFFFPRPKDADALSRFGYALAKCFPGPFLLSREGESSAFLKLCDGLRQANAKVLHSDASLASVSAYSAAAASSYGVHLMSNEESTALKLFLPDGLPIRRSDRKRLIAAFRSCPSFVRREEEMKRESFGAQGLYLTSLLSCLPACADGIRVQTKADSLLSRALAARAWTDGEGERVELELSEDGEDCRVVFSEGTSYSFEHLRALFTEGKSEEAAKGLVRSLREGTELPERGSLWEHRELFDACYALCRFLSLVERESLAFVKRRLSQIEIPCVVKRFCPHDGKYGSFSRRLDCLFGRNEGEELVYYRPQGILRIVPSAHRGYRIYAQSRRAEAAQELCDFAFRALHPEEK